MARDQGGAPVLGLVGGAAVTVRSVLNAPRTDESALPRTPSSCLLALPTCVAERLSDCLVPLGGVSNGLSGQRQGSCRPGPRSRSQPGLGATSRRWAGRGRGWSG